MDDERNFELIEVTRKRRPEKGGRHASAGGAARTDEPARAHRYANVDDPKGLHRRHAADAAPGGTQVAQADGSLHLEEVQGVDALAFHSADGHVRDANVSGETGRVHHSTHSSQEASHHTHHSGHVSQAASHHTHSSTHRSHRQYQDYGDVDLGPLPALDLDALTEEPAGQNAPAPARASGEDVYVKVMNRKYRKSSQLMIRIWIAVIILAAAVLLVLILSRTAMQDDLLPRPERESAFPSETAGEAETMRSNW